MPPHTDMSPERTRQGENNRPALKVSLLKHRLASAKPFSPSTPSLWAEFRQTGACTTGLFQKSSTADDRLLRWPYVTEPSSTQPILFLIPLLAPGVPWGTAQLILSGLGTLPAGTGAWDHSGSSSDSPTAAAANTTANGPRGKMAETQLPASHSTPSAPQNEDLCLLLFYGLMSQPESQGNALPASCLPAGTW